VNLVLAIVVGGLYAAGLYLMVRRSIVKLILGLVLLGHASNLLIFAAGANLAGEHGQRGAPPLVHQGQDALTPPFADPLPQALILTAIVIGFGVLAFALVMVHKVYQAVGTDDLDRMRATDA
jgi:multicomponent Na+:H+ antiporter subunit C